MCGRRAVGAVLVLPLCLGIGCEGELADPAVGAGTAAAVSQALGAALQGVEPPTLKLTGETSQNVMSREVALKTIIDRVVQQVQAGSQASTGLSPLQTIQCQTVTCTYNPTTGAWTPSGTITGSCNGTVAQGCFEATVTGNWSGTCAAGIQQASFKADVKNSQLNCPFAACPGGGSMVLAAGPIAHVEGQVLPAVDVKGSVDLHLGFNNCTLSVAGAGTVTLNIQIPSLWIRGTYDNGNFTYSVSSLSIQVKGTLCGRTVNRDCLIHYSSTLGGFQTGDMCDCVLSNAPAGGDVCTATCGQ